MSYKKNKISVAPKFFLHGVYLDQIEKLFIKWNTIEFNTIEKRYGRRRVGKILAGKFPPEERVEKNIKKNLKGKELKNWIDENALMFLCLVDLDHVAQHNVDFYYSFFIYLVADFEHVLNDICNNLKNKRINQIFLKDINGKGIDRALLYLKKVSELKLPEEKYIQDLIVIRDIRNCIIHSAGYTTDDKFIKIIQKYSGLNILKEDSGQGVIHFGKEFSEYVFKTMSHFLKKLVENNSSTFFAVSKL